jgi:hypothetical protein
MIASCGIISRKELRQSCSYSIPNAINLLLLFMCWLFNSSAQFPSKLKTLNCSQLILTPVAYCILRADYLVLVLAVNFHLFSFHLIRLHHSFFSCGLNCFRVNLLSFTFLLLDWLFSSTLNHLVFLSLVISFHFPHFIFLS